MEIAAEARPPEDGAAAPEAGPRNLRDELAAAMKLCTPKQRKWLKAIPENDYQPWRAGTILGYSTRSVQKWLRDVNCRKVRELLDEIAVEDMDLTQRRILAEYSKLGFSDIRKLFSDAGELLPPQSWPDDIAGAVASIDTKETRLKDEAGNFINEWEVVHKIKLHDKKGSLDFLASFRKMSGAKRIEVTGKDGSPLAGAAPIIQFVERVDPD
jgi:hypothetical protein